MIGHFPEAYPDELLYSICARCCDRIAYPGKQSLAQELFGTRNVLASVELPSHLDTLIAALPAGHHYTADRLIDNHTLFPYYGPFLPPARLIRIRQDMQGNSGPAIHMRIGIMASRVSLPRWLRSCALCVQDDRNKFGECYWHRIHQAPGVEVCPLHKVYLQNSSILAQNSRVRYAFVSAEYAMQQKTLQQPVPVVSSHEAFLSVALDALWLLRQHQFSQGPQSLYQRYRKLLADRDLATYKGRVFIGDAQQKFRSHFSPEILEKLHCKIDESIHENWLMRLVRKPDNAQHPLHHILLIHFLGHSVETFFNVPLDGLPFGEGPWPCLNPTSDHYKHCQIGSCQIDYSQYTHGRPVGTFSCGCGFVYSRTGPDRSVEDLFMLSKVKTFGYVWEERLKQLWENESYSLREIARQLGVDPLTVKRHVTRLELLLPRPVGMCRPLKEAQQLQSHGPRVPEPSTVVELYRSVWLAATQENSRAGVRALRKKLPQIYSWLYRNDRAWLNEHTPSRIKQETQHHHSPIDWENRDAEMAGSVIDSVLRLRESAGRPTRITISSIGRDIGQLALLQQHLDKLPLTAKSLDKLVETREAFAVRRIFWTIEQYKREQHPPTRWQLIKRAGVERLITCPRVKETIDVAVKTPFHPRE